MYGLTQEVFREEPRFTKLAFDRLLEWLDDGSDSNGETYLEMHRRLVSYFDRRNRQSADELADETLNRISKTLQKDGAIATKPPARYCYVVAKFVLLEDIRREQRHVRLVEQPAFRASTRQGERLAPFDKGPDDTQEQRLECLERCLHTLSAEQRELIVEYYSDGRSQKIERRREMAKRLGITMNALGIRACRIRNTLEACVEACRKER